MIRDDRLDQNYRTHDVELGADVTRPLLGGGLKLIGLVTRRHRINVDTSFNRVQSQVTGGFVQLLDEHRSETLARLVWSRPDLLGWSVETGLEGGDQPARLQCRPLLGRAGRRAHPDRPAGRPGAASSNIAAKPSSMPGARWRRNLRMDLGLTYETSRLAVRGDTRADRSLRFLKPKAAFDWRPGGGWHAQLSIARTVAQLDFGDFISGAELANNRVNGGNPDLLPQRAWEVLATLEHPLLARRRRQAGARL